MAEISVRGLSKVYPNGVVAVRDVHLEVADGEFLVLVGPSGLRQVDLAADDRRARGGDRRTSCRSTVATSPTPSPASATSPWCSRATRCIRT